MQDDNDCPVCHGEGFVITCCDDMCRGQGSCIHGDGEEICMACGGDGTVCDDDWDDFDDDDQTQATETT